MRRNFKNRLKRLLAIPMAVVAASAALISGASAVYADETVNSNVKSAEKGVYAIELVYTDKNENKGFAIQSGTAFFINDDTLVTCNHVVTMTADIEKLVTQEAKSRYNSYSSSNLSVEVMLQSDVSIPATVVTSSADADWAILQVRDAIKTTPLKIGNSSEAQNTQSIYAIGYPAMVAKVGSAKNFSKDDITTTKGQISKITQANGVDIIQHGATISAGNSGGPLVDENGAVIGVNRSGKTSADYYFAVAMEQIVDVLEQRKIDYTRNDGQGGGDQTTTTAESSEPTPDTTTSEDTTTTAIAPAPVDSSNSDSSAAPATVTAKEDDSSSSGLDTKMIILIVAGAVVLILIIVIIIVVAGGKKQPQPVGYSQNRPQQMPQQMPQARPQQMPQPQQPQQPQQMQQPYQPQSSATMLNNAGETTVLSAGGAAGETTVLGASMSMFSLVRRKTGEPISINKQSFIIGKDTSADFCVTGNSSISRNHARFTVNNGQCFVSDMRSTNGTFVNGLRVAPNQEVPVKPGDIVKLSDEEFEFKG